MAAVWQLSFEAPDPKRFPALRVAREALGAGGGAPTVLNAANEVAVEGFLAGKLGFLDISKVVEDTLETMPTRPPGTIEEVWELDCEARRLAAGRLGLAGQS